MNTEKILIQQEVEKREAHSNSLAEERLKIERELRRNAILITAEKAKLKIIIEAIESGELL
jgi:hypothetical protein